MDHICWIDDTVCEECSVDYVPLDDIDVTELGDGSVVVIDKYEEEA